jgi:hypothetical protein
MAISSGGVTRDQLLGLIDDYSARLDNVKVPDQIPDWSTLESMMQVIWGQDHKISVAVKQVYLDVESDPVITWHGAEVEFSNALYDAYPPEHFTVADKFGQQVSNRRHALARLRDTVEMVPPPSAGRRTTRIPDSTSPPAPQININGNVYGTVQAAGAGSSQTATTNVDASVTNDLAAFAELLRTALNNDQDVEAHTRQALDAQLAAIDSERGADRPRWPLIRGWVLTVLGILGGAGLGGDWAKVIEIGQVVVTQLPG